MAEFDRRFLIDHGLPQQQAEAVLEAFRQAVSAALEGSVTEAEAQRRVEEALEKANGQAGDAGGEAYRRLLEERDMLRAIGGEAFAAVKPKFREQVYGMLDHGRGAAPLEAQLEALRGKFEEFFEDASPRGERQPRFGAPVRGSMPRGELGTDGEFARVWGFGRK